MAGEMLARWMYCSEISDQCDNDALVNLVRVSRARNGARGVTGLLLAHEALFLQVIEGPQAAVARLFREISFDYRADQVTILSKRSVSHRMFSEWTFGMVGGDRALRKATGAFDMTGSNMRSLLCGAPFLDIHATPLLTTFASMRGNWRAIA